MSEPTFPIEMMDARLMLAHPQNFRRHPLAQVREIDKSIKKFGWLQNVVWNRRTGFILNGHARIEIAAKLEQFVPVRVVDVDEKVEKQIILALDKTGEGREIDEESLAALLTEVVRDTGELPPGWSENELEDLLKATAPEEDEEEVEEDEAVLSDEIPEGIPLASIRMVQLYLTQEMIDEWQGWVATLAQEFETTTTTDTVVSAVKAAYHYLCVEDEDADPKTIQPTPRSGR